MSVRAYVSALTIVVAFGVAAIPIGFEIHERETIRDRYRWELFVHCHAARVSAHNRLERLTEVSFDSSGVERIVEDIEVRHAWRQRCAANRLPEIPRPPTVAALREYLRAVSERIPDEDPKRRGER